MFFQYNSHGILGLIYPLLSRTDCTYIIPDRCEVPLLDDFHQEKN